MIDVYVNMNQKIRIQCLLCNSIRMIKPGKIVYCKTNIKPCDKCQ